MQGVAPFDNGIPQPAQLLYWARQGGIAGLMGPCGPSIVNVAVTDDRDGRCVGTWQCSIQVVERSTTSTTTEGSEGTKEKSRSSSSAAWIQLMGVGVGEDRDAVASDVRADHGSVFGPEWVPLMWLPMGAVRHLSHGNTHCGVVLRASQLRMATCADGTGSVIIPGLVTLHLTASDAAGRKLIFEMLYERRAVVLARAAATKEKRSKRRVDGERDPATQKNLHSSSPPPRSLKDGFGSLHEDLARMRASVAVCQDLLHEANSLSTAPAAAVAVPPKAVASAPWPASHATPALQPSKPEATTPRGLNPSSSSNSVEWAATLLRQRALGKRQ